MAQAIERKTESIQSVASVMIGDGWAALGAVGFLAQDGREIRWITGNRSRLIAPTQSIEAGPGAWVWKELASRMGVATGNLQIGSWLREFRNKSFREPAWAHGPTLAARGEIRDESLMGAEARLAGALDARFDSPLFEVEEQIRLKLAGFPNVRRIEGIAVSGIRSSSSASADERVVTLASGEEIACRQVIFADRWSDLGMISGVPKGLGFARGIEPRGVLQASFRHRQPIAAGIPETFFGALQREAGEESTRNVFGWFADDGMSSVWSVCLSEEETEDNHEIAKKLRRIKQALEKMFGGSDWLPSGVPHWQANIQDEKVRFVESALFASHSPPSEAIRVSSLPGVEFLTDGFGPSQALAQVQRAIGQDLSITLEGADDWLNDGLGAAAVSPTEMSTGP